MGVIYATLIPGGIVLVFVLVFARLIYNSKDLFDEDDEPPFA